MPRLGRQVALWKEAPARRKEESLFRSNRAGSSSTGMVSRRFTEDTEAAFPKSPVALQGSYLKPSIALLFTKGSALWRQRFQSRGVIFIQEEAGTAANSYEPSLFLIQQKRSNGRKSWRMK